MGPILIGSETLKVLTGMSFMALPTTAGAWPLPPIDTRSAVSHTPLRSLSCN